MKNTTERESTPQPIHARMDFNDEEEWDDDYFCDYDDFVAVGGVGGGRGGKGSKKKKGAGKSGPYSAKHTRLRENRAKSNKGKK